MYRALLIIILTLFIASGCSKTYTPKPRGYFRIELPEKAYKETPDVLPYKFEYPKYSYLEEKSGAEHEHYWINMVFPSFKARIHLSYKPVNNNIGSYLEDSRNFVYKHTIKADAISEVPYIDNNKKVYALFYEIKGDAASNVQFVITDSSKNFLRGALYFNAVPNKDSLAPVLDFINEDIKHLIETFEWK